MFEQELELEKREGSGLGPVIIIIALIALLVGGLGYFLWDANRTIKPEDATALLSTAINSNGPTSVSFHTGNVTSSYGDSVNDVQYKLLEKAGIISVKPRKDKTGAQIDLTPAGEKMLAAIPNVKKTSESDGTVTYKIPLATKQLLQVNSVTKLAPKRAAVEYTWKWVPNEMGKEFDAGGPNVKSFGTYDRSVLIDKYGAQFYSADQPKVTVVLARGPEGWQPTKE